MTYRWMMVVMAGLAVGCSDTETVARGSAGGTAGAGASGGGQAGLGGTSGGQGGASAGQAGAAQAGAGQAGAGQAGQGGAQAGGQAGAVSGGQAGQAGQGGGAAAGASGSGGLPSGGQAGQSGAAGAGAGGAAAGQGGAAGVSGQGGASGVAELLEACVRVNACEADGGTPMGLQQCLGYALDRAALWASVGPGRMAIEAMGCKLEAKDCATVRACTPPLAPHVALCAEHPGSGVCAGSTWVFCDDLGAPVSAFDCAAAGLACQTDVWAGCGLTPCKFGETEAKCDPDDPGVLIECSPAGFLTRVDCRTEFTYVKVSGKGSDSTYAIAGEVCGFDPMRGATSCIGTGEECPFFSQSCDGDVLTTCAGGKLAHRDCSKQAPPGQSCGFAPSGPYAGAALCGLVAPPCPPDANETCTGTTIGFCQNGQAATLDCATAGYTTCATATQGARTIAYCLP